MKKFNSSRVNSNFDKIAYVLSMKPWQIFQLHKNWQNYENLFDINDAWFDINFPDKCWKFVSKNVQN